MHAPTEHACRDWKRYEDKVVGTKQQDEQWLPFQGLQSDICLILIHFCFRSVSNMLDPNNILFFIPYFSFCLMNIHILPYFWNSEYLCMPPSLTDKWDLHFFLNAQFFLQSCFRYVIVTGWIAFIDFYYPIFPPYIWGGHGATFALWPGCLRSHSAGVGLHVCDLWLPKSVDGMPYPSCLTSPWWSLR